MSRGLTISFPQARPRRERNTGAAGDNRACRAANTHRDVTAQVILAYPNDAAVPERRQIAAFDSALDRCEGIGEMLRCFAEGE